MLSEPTLQSYHDYRLIWQTKPEILPANTIGLPLFGLVWQTQKSFHSLSVASPKSNMVWQVYFLQNYRRHLSQKLSACSV